MKRLLSQIAGAILGLWLAATFVPGVIVRAYPESSIFGFPLTAQWEIFLLLGIVLGLLNYFLKPLLKTIALPLEIITLGFFTFIIDMGLIWVLAAIFDELYIPLFIPLAYTTLLVWACSLAFQLILVRNKE